MANLGGPQTHLQIDLGFGDVVEAIDYSLDLISTSKGPLFESKIQVLSYPKEFIFAEKLETVIQRGIGNTRMKDFHDLYTLISLQGCLKTNYIDKVVVTVFNHRQTSLQKLPLQFDNEYISVLQPLWEDYLQDLSSSQMTTLLPESIKDVISAINVWLIYNTQLCTSETAPSMDQNCAQYVYLTLGHFKLYKSRLVKLTHQEANELNSSEDHLCQPLIFETVSKKWQAQYDHNKIYEVVLFYVHGDSGRGFVTYNSQDYNRTYTKLDKAQLGEIILVPGYFLNDWNNRIDAVGTLYFWFQPIGELPPKMRKRIVDVAKIKHPYNTFD